MFSESSRDAALIHRQVLHRDVGQAFLFVHQLNLTYPYPVLFEARDDTCKSSAKLTSLTAVVVFVCLGGEAGGVMCTPRTMHRRKPLASEKNIFPLYLSVTTPVAVAVLADSRQ